MLYLAALLRANVCLNETCTKDQKASESMPAKPPHVPTGQNNTFDNTKAEPN